jgi:hypothetical protein
MPDIKAFSYASLQVDEHGTKAIKDTERGTVITMIASTAAVDRDGEIIEVGGWSVPPVLPKLLWGHNYADANAVIGRLTKVWTQDGDLMIEAELADKVDGHADAKLIAGLLKSGFLDQGSVGFLPHEWMDPDGKIYTRENPGSWYGSTPGRRYRKQELLEFSITAVPSQRESLLASARALGLTDVGPNAARPAPAEAKADEAEPAAASDPVPACLTCMAKDALPDPGDDWLMGLLKNTGHGSADADLSRGDGQDKGDNWLAFFLGEHKDSKRVA